MSNEGFIKFYSVRGKIGDYHRYSRFYDQRKFNFGVTIVLLYRNKYADIYYDWDDGEKGMESLREIHDLHVHDIYTEIENATRLFIPKANAKIYTTGGKLFDIPYDSQNPEHSTANHLAHIICYIYEKYLLGG